MKNKNILFITEKFCDGDSRMGLTNHYHNLFGSFKSTGLGDYKVIHYDTQDKESFKREVGRTIHYYSDPNFLPSYVVLSYLGTHPSNPDDSILKDIKSLQIPIIVIWPDTAYLWAINKINSLGDLVDLHVSFGSEDVTHNYPDKQLWMWAPQDPKLFYKDKDEKINIASFVGSLNGYGDRYPYLNYVRANFKDLIVTGGQREQKLTHTEYANYIRRSKIGINFPESPSGKDQCKGRVIEILASGNLLLERKNEATRKLFKPGFDYLEFESPEDLLAQINAYIKDEHTASVIAYRGYNTYKQKYNPKIFWETILDKV